MKYGDMASSFQRAPKVFTNIILLNHTFLKVVKSHIMYSTDFYTNICTRVRRGKLRDDYQRPMLPKEPGQDSQSPASPTDRLFTLQTGAHAHNSSSKLKLRI